MVAWETALTLGLMSGLAAAGFLASLLLGRVPKLFVAAVLGGWAIVMVAAGAWYASCTRCTSHASYDSARDIDFWMAVYFGGFVSACILGVAWLASLLSILWRKALGPKRPAGQGRSP
jgi:hypothetical protein